MSCILPTIWACGKMGCFLTVAIPDIHCLSFVFNISINTYFQHDKIFGNMFWKHLLYHLVWCTQLSTLMGTIWRKMQFFIDLTRKQWENASLCMQLTRLSKLIFYHWQSWYQFTVFGSYLFYYNTESFT